MARVVFRRFRITVWVIILLLLGCFVYLNQIGLPGFIKGPLLQAVRARGVDLEFTRLRWRWGHGVVAENVRFGPAAERLNPAFRIREAQVQLDYRALARLRVAVNGLVLRNGRLDWSMPETNGAAHVLSIENVETELRLLPGDQWELRNFEARFAGAQLYLGGVITNASAIREWKFLHGAAPSAPGTLEKRLQQVAETMEKIRFAGTPELKLDVRGDARDLKSFTVRLNVDTPDAETPWGSVQEAFFTLVLLPAPIDGVSHARVDLYAARAATRWAGITNLVLRLNVETDRLRQDLVSARLELSAGSIETAHVRASGATFTAGWMHSLTNAIPLSGEGTLRVEGPETKWGGADAVRVTGSLVASDGPVVSDPAWSWWTNLAPFAINWECSVQGLRSEKLQAEEFSAAGEWRSPRLTVDRLNSTLYGGLLRGRASLNVDSRELQFSGSSDFDAHRLGPLLTEKSRKWLSQYTWRRPPAVQAEGTLVLPAWTNRHPDWRGEVRPTVTLNGNFDVGPGAFRGVAFSSARSRFSYSNLVWRLPDLVAVRPEGRLELAHASNEATRDYYFRLRSTIDVKALEPLLKTNNGRGLDIVEFTQPPLVAGEVWGRWYQPELIRFRGSVAATNFTVRGQAVGSAEARVAFTNGVLYVFEPRVQRGAEHLSASAVQADFNTHRVYLTNGVGYVDPLAVARAIGPRIGQHMEPYRFGHAVRARVNGIIPMRDERDANVRFEIEGGAFEWWKFRVPEIEGRLDWVGEKLSLRNVHAEFYGGTAVGEADFDFARERGADFSFDVLVTDAELRLLMRDMTSHSNRLEGRLNGRLTITQGTSTDIHSVQGRGRVDLTDGFIWDIPIFGILTPALDGIAPGLGSSRARAASGTFIVTNGVLRTEDFEIRAPVMRLQYNGDVDLTGRVNARVQAELLRDIPAVGPMVSLVLWPVSKVYEYRITGTVQKPESEPIFFIPRILALPFHPLRTIREILPTVPQESRPEELSNQ